MHTHTHTYTLRFSWLPSNLSPSSINPFKIDFGSNSVGVVCLYDGRLPVHVCGPVAQVEDEEKDGENDARYLVHFADSVVRLLGFCVGIIHSMEIGVFGRCAGRSTLRNGC